MSRFLPQLAALALSVVLGVALLAGFGAASGSIETRVFEVELEAARPGSAPVTLRLDVAAEDPQAARAAGLRAVESLGWTVATSDAGAQWLPWSWKWDAGEIPVDVAYNPTGAPLSVSPAMILGGLQAWSNVPGSSFAYRYTGITDNVASILELGPDGENVVSWASLPCEQGCVLGLTSKGAAHEVDMLLNSNPAAAEQLGVGARVDWRTVILHELGHMAGLEHSCPVPFGPCTDAEGEAVMFFSYRGLMRQLADDDKAGLVALYPAQATSPTPQPTLSPGVTPTPTPFPELPVLLERGWNLVVLPPGPVSSVTDILTCASAVYSFEEGEWRTWIRGAPASLQELDAFEAGRAYWLLADGFCAHVFP